jgi:hypothetical protein
VAVRQREEEKKAHEAARLAVNERRTKELLDARVERERQARQAAQARAARAAANEVVFASALAPRSSCGTSRSAQRA